MSPVPVREITAERLQRWISDCAHDQATPVALIAVGHDEHAGDVHCYTFEDGPLSDEDLGALIAQVAITLMHGG